ncbi:uncharacterized protein LOC121734971 [Aricia agestis]|uniref:uncharacterized protein LOC121734971 n=1 Tax=Aricia agestis TaxID=91739 RepID=UPI001C20204D|nr:uncharacterized protein LOC121734971 [Aricia agestis]
MWKKILPKKFLHKYSLSIGALLGGITFIVIAVLCIIGLLVQLLSYKDHSCASSPVYVTAFSFSATGILYHLLLVMADAWMIWGVSQRKSSILLSWVILSAMWVAQTFCVLVVMVLVRRSEVAVGVWVIYLMMIIGLTCILTYIILVVCSLWLELKGTRTRTLDETTRNENL